MTCAAFVEYTKDGSMEPHAFVYRRLLAWNYGTWKLASVAPLPPAEATRLMALSSIGSGTTWSDAASGAPVDSFESAVVRMPAGWDPIMSPPYFLAQMWVWTEDGWCLQTERRNW